MDSEQMVIDTIVDDVQVVLESKAETPSVASPNMMIEPPPARNKSPAVEEPKLSTEPPVLRKEPENPVALSSTQRPSPTEPSPTSTSDSRPLNVTDALTYLDNVKSKFKEQPDVYNHFLDIMKEFKNQLIDTPGVIKRVSHLFNGHPSLIQGFNTFLPVGYRIECTSDASSNSNYITVTMPTGSMMRTTNNGRDKGPILWHDIEPGSSMIGIPGRSIDSVRPPPRSTATPDPSTFLADGQAIAPAVHYVNKIKQTCDPETYRIFLNILSQYHNGTHEMDQAEVSKQISNLFKNNPELRDDFRIFLPDSRLPMDDDTAMLIESAGTRMGTPSGDHKGKRRAEALPPSVSPSKRRRKMVEKEREVISSKPLPKIKKVKHAPIVSQDAGPSQPPKYAVSVSSERTQNLPTATPHTTHVPEAHIKYFDRVRRAMDNRETYNEFLKVVNLFTQGHIETARLVKESLNFLGDGELWREFLEILGWDQRKVRENRQFEQAMDSGWTRPTIVGIEDHISQPGWSGKQGSYRKLPTTDVSVPCSGRDEMCRKVLNDEWVSHPTWSSEDPVFVVPTKNVYEDALHRSEEERHEFDFHIEAIVRTIAMLEPLNNKIAQMGIEERNSFKPKPNLGGAAKAIHHRVIKKIYGRDAGMTVISAMQDSPAMAIPIVLQRLKHKEEEWKRAQREWNKVWREVDARNYAKSLDHQGITFKTADKKALTTKMFVSQIEAAAQEQLSVRRRLVDPLFDRTKPHHQLEFVIDDVQVLQDAMKLTFSFLDRTHTTIPLVERKKMEAFLRSFVPLFFMLEPGPFNAALEAVEELSDVETGSTADDVEVSSTASGGSRTGKNRKGGAGGDLRKRLLKSEQAKSTGRKPKAKDPASPVTSRFSSPIPVDEDSRVDGTAKPTRGVFYSNTIFYSLLRLLEVLYSRLSRFKAITKKLVDDNIARDLNPLPEELGYAEAEFSRSGDRLSNASHFYELMLESCERLFDNDIEQYAFEDQMRYMFGTKDAYRLFTIDKVIGALLKQVQNVFADSQSQDLLETLKRDRALLNLTVPLERISQTSVRDVLGPDENMFRIVWDSESHSMTIELIRSTEVYVEDDNLVLERWQTYLDSYVGEITIGIPQSKVRRPFLRRNIPTEVVKPQILTSDGMEIKVCCRTYRIFFVTGSEDFMARIPDSESLAARFEATEGRRKEWLEKFSAATVKVEE